jgi:DNA uptake protein ComE-like DNA-binding protein
VLEDLPLAAELRIGRPDLERTYDDGGLVDVNHVPADTLVVYLDMAPEVAREIVRTRAIRDGFTSADDLLISVDCLNPARLDMIRDRLIFIPSDLTSTLPHDGA